MFQILLSELCFVQNNQTMKQLSLSIIIAIFFSLIFGAEMSAVSKTSGQEVIPVVITPKPPVPGGNPRSPETSPYSAYHTTDYVYLSSDIDCGCVDVELYSTAGDSYSTVFSLSDENIIIPISGDSGEYVLTITDQLGQVFIGVFTII